MLSTATIPPIARGLPCAERFNPVTAQRLDPAAPRACISARCVCRANTAQRIRDHALNLPPAGRQEAQLRAKAMAKARRGARKANGFSIEVRRLRPSRVPSSVPLVTPLALPHHRRRLRFRLLFLCLPFQRWLAQPLWPTPWRLQGQTHLGCRPRLPGLRSTLLFLLL